LVDSIKSIHANHSLKLFVSLLASLESAYNHAPSSSHLARILAVVVHNAFGLVRDCQGVRMINVLLDEFGSSQRVAPLLDRLLDEPIGLAMLIVDEFANYAINAALDVEHERICQVVRTHFVEYAMNKYANHVVQKCIEVATNAWVTCFNDLFIANGDELASQQLISSCVRRTLETTLSKRGLRCQMHKLQSIRDRFLRVSL
jgi:hypothetical protein